MATESQHSFLDEWDEEEKELGLKIYKSLNLSESSPSGITQLKHMHQLDTWDCGLTCIQMILNWLEQNDVRINNSWVDQKWMREFVGTESIWTIDLVVLLRYALRRSRCRRDHVKGENNTFDHSAPNATTHPPLSYLFCSTKFGVDESYNQLRYYKDAFQDDLQRVEQLFASATQDNLPLLQVSHLSMRVLVDFVSKKGCVAIVLLDNRVLLRSIEDTAINDTLYSGHYVILCGISHNINDVSYAKLQCLEETTCDEDFCMVLKNPGCWKESEFVTAKRFEEAWRANGTDEDIILINFCCK